MYFQIFMKYMETFTKVVFLNEKNDKLKSFIYSLAKFAKSIKKGKSWKFECIKDNLSYLNNFNILQECTI
jgi:hypothetical protein